MTTIEEKIAQARLQEDDRILKTFDRDVFEQAAKLPYKSSGIGLCILQRPDEEKAALEKIYKAVKNFRSRNTNVDLTTRITPTENSIDISIPQPLIELGAEADLLQTAQTYSRLSGYQKFLIRLATIDNSFDHAHEEDVLSTAWNGNGLAVHKMEGHRSVHKTVMAQGDMGYVKRGMRHESDKPTPVGRIVNFTAPNFEGH